MTTHKPALVRACLAIAAIVAVWPGHGIASNQIVTSQSATGQVAAQAADTVLRFVGRAVEVEWAGGDALPLPRGDGALARLARHLPFRQLVTAGEAAFNGQGYDRLLVVGTELADRALRLAERPAGLRLHGATRFIRGVAPEGRFSGRGLSLALGGARALASDLVAGATVGLERSQLRAGGDDRLFSRGWTAAGELGWHPSHGLALAASVGAGVVSRTLSLDGGRVTASPDAHRGFIALRAEHSWERSGFRLSPSLRLSFTTEMQDAYTDSGGMAHDDRSTHYGRATGGVEVGYHFDLGHGGLDVYGGVQADWDFLRFGHVTLTAMRWNDDMPVRGVVATGVTLTSDAGFASTLEVRNDAIGPEGLNRTRLQASVAFAF